MDQKRLNKVLTQAGNDEEILRSLRDCLHQSYGIYFDDEKLYSFSNKINQRIRKLPVDDLEEYVQYFCDNRSEEVQKFLDTVSTNKTLFFREKKHWQFLEDHILPSLSSDNTPIKMWSAACSTGEEPYTLSMIMEDRLDEAIRPSQWGTKTNGHPGSHYKILATDIARKAVMHAQNGVYKQEKLENVRDYDESYVRRFFEPVEDTRDQYRIKDCLRNSSTFRKFNLKNNRYPFEGTFSLVLCRNVLIYFDDDMVEHVIHQLRQSLEPGGYLFVGHTESLQNIDHGLEKVQSAVYRRPKTSRVRNRDRP